MARSWKNILTISNMKLLTEHQYEKRLTDFANYVLAKRWVAQVTHADYENYKYSLTK